MTKRITGVLLCLAITACGQTPTVATVGDVHTTTVNFAVDLAGTPDNRPNIWGSSGFVQQMIQFHPPAGYKTHILHISGDFIGWPKAGIVAAGTYCETGWGLKTTAADGSAFVTQPQGGAPYDNTLVWVQSVINPGNASARASFDRDSGMVLPSDNILISQTFVALNTTKGQDGQPLTMHMEPTFTVTYRFEVQ